MRLRALLREAYIKIRFYRPWGGDAALKGGLFFFIGDGYHKVHPGLADRFKAIVGLYDIAVQNHLPLSLKPISCRIR